MADEANDIGRWQGNRQPGLNLFARRIGQVCQVASGESRWRLICNHGGAAAPPYLDLGRADLPVRRNFAADKRSDVGGIGCNHHDQTFSVSRNSATAFSTHPLSGKAYGRNVSAVPACAL